jgi:hypothetical protein
MDLAYLGGTDEECLVTKLSGGIWAIRFSDLKQFNILDASGLGIIMYSAVSGSNRNHIYLAVESKGLDPDVAWSPYLGELVQVPLVTTGPGAIRRLVHHRARTHNGSFHYFADQPEPWINHAGDRLFFRSNMDNYTEPGKNDLYMIDLNEPALGTDDEIQVNNELQFYPNPINDFVYVSLSNQLAHYQYRLFNLSGELVQEGVLDGNRINCSTLQSGMYLLNVYSGKEGYRVKIIKN